MTAHVLNTCGPPVSVSVYGELRVGDGAARACGGGP